jgi:uncharacterized protein (DUF2062 family)
VPFRAGWRKTREWFIHLLHLDDSAHRIALGAALGVFIAFTPTIGFQMLLVLLVTSAVRANKVAGLPMPWITNPVTILPMFSFNYYVGWRVVGGPGLKGFQDQLFQLMSLDLGWIDWVKGWWHLMIDMAGPLWVGSLIVGFGAGLVAYGVMFYLIRVYRRHHRRRQAQEKEARARSLAEAAGATPADTEPVEGGTGGEAA